jgi:phosphohistidine phosphatase
VAAGAEESQEVQVVDDLYGADVDDVLDMLRGLRDAPDRLMVVGHNPTMAELAWALEQDSDSDWPDNLPTSGIVVVDFDESWNHVDRECGRISQRFVARG